MNVFSHSVWFWRTIFHFLWENSFDPRNLPNSGKKSIFNICLKNWLKMVYFCNLCKNKYFFWSDLLKMQENSPYFSRKASQNFPNFPGNSDKYFPGNGKRKFGISREFPGREFPGCHPYYPPGTPLLEAGTLINFWKRSNQKFKLERNRPSANAFSFWNILPY